MQARAASPWKATDVVVRARALWVALVLTACGPTAEPINACEGPDSGDPACVPCTLDQECVFTGNPCEDIVLCAHAAAPVLTTSLGCSPAIEARWPPDDQCVCAADGWCSVE